MSSTTPVGGAQRTHRRARAAVVMAVMAAMLLSAVQAVAVNEELDSMVSQRPVNWTPHVLDGIVETVAVQDAGSAATAGDLVVVGGSFDRIARETSASPQIGDDVYPPASPDAGESQHPAEDILDHPALFAFDRTDGSIDEAFAPGLTADATVTEAVLPGDGTVIAGGEGLTGGRNIVKYDLSTGSVVSGFAASTQGRVFDLVLRNGILYAGVNSSARGTEETTGALIALDPATGTPVPGFSVELSGAWTGGSLEPSRPAVGDGDDSTAHVRVVGLDVTADGERLVAVGNFNTVEGRSREGVVVLDLAGNVSGQTATLANWQTDRYPPGVCLVNLDVYMRGVDISPDGEYMVIYTTGFMSRTHLCDTAVRWELGGVTGQGLEPTWVSYSGGDTFTEVAVTGGAVYVGGHFYWLNAFYAAFSRCTENGVQQDDCPTPGGVERIGMAALDARNGVPFSWDPGRARGEGVYAITSADEGVYMGSDTRRWNINNRETDDLPSAGESSFNQQYQNRLALFPIAPSIDIDHLEAAPLPTQLHQVMGSSGDVEARNFDGEQVGTARTLDLGLPGLRGGFVLDDRLYHGAADGTFQYRAFHGSAVGDPRPVRPLPSKDDHLPLTGEYTLSGGRGNPDIVVTPFPAGQVSGMTYDHVTGQMYYTLEGDSSLYHRPFTEQSNIVGDRCWGQAPSGASGMHVDWSQVRGLHLDVVSGRIFFGHTDGHLYAADFADGHVTSPRRIAGPAIDGTTWGQGELFTHGDGSTIPGSGSPTPADTSRIPQASARPVGPMCHQDERTSEPRNREEQPDGVSPAVLGGPVAVSKGVEAALDAMTGGEAPRRWAGGDRFATAVRISEATFDPGVPVAYVANGLNFPDALAGGAAAGLLGGPVLLVSTDDIPDVVAAELQRLDPQRIVVLGGPVAVGAQVEGQLAALTSGEVDRYGGGDRYATASLLSAATFDPGVDNVWIATGENFPDALAAGPAAVMDGGPILLVGRDTVPQVVVDEVARLAPGRITIAGGELAVSAAVQARLHGLAARGASRVAGGDRFDTAAKISTQAFEAGAPQLFAATGLNFPDALAGVAAAGRAGSPILLVSRTEVPQATAVEVARLDALAAGRLP